MRTVSVPLTFEAFYRARWHEAARWAAAVVGRVDVGEEIAQEVFGRLAARYETLDNPVGYLRTAIVNSGRSWLRSEGRSTRREERMARERSVPDRSSGADESQADAETLALLDALPERQRTVVVLRYWADWADTDIAAAMGCGESTVRSLARRGLAKLREEMER